MKKRILFVGEASPLMTGFAKYYHYVLKRIFDSGRFEIAELGSYMSQNDPRAKQIPWKFYGVLPDIVPDQRGGFYHHPQQEKIYKKNYNQNQFGKWKWNHVLADFKPDYVFDLRDAWMVDWERDTPFRSYFKWCLMACVDGHPQKPEWLSMYSKTEALFSYSKYGKEVLERESKGVLKVISTPSPGVDTEMYKPKDKKEMRQKYNLDPDCSIIGTVMRNQQRKLFPRLIVAFSKLIKNKKNKPYLLLHTSIPDVGWDIPLEIQRNDLHDQILFTYICRNCDDITISKFKGEKSNCSKCEAKDSVATPNTSKGVSQEQLVDIYNLMDVYVQASVCEGYGMPIPEAKACGIPVIGADWSAVSEQVHAPGGLPIKIATWFTDHGTMQRRSLFSIESFIKQCQKVLSWKEKRRKQFGLEGRESVIGSWDKAANILIDYFESDADIDRSRTWDKPYQLRNPSLPTPQNLSYEEAVRWLYKKMGGMPPNEKSIKKWIKDGVPLEKLEKLFRDTARTFNEGEKVRCDIVEQATSVVSVLDPNDTFRILYCMPKTAGDVLLSTAVVAGLKKRYPEASIYFATEEKYVGILKDNPNIKLVLAYDENLINYRLSEGYGPEEGNFDICFNPYIITQKMSHWINNGHGKHLLKAYADMCDVVPGKAYIGTEPFHGLPKEYITVHAGSSLDIKNYSLFDSVLYYCKAPVVLVGSETDPLTKCDIDLRGKTTVQQLAYVLKNAKCHIGCDSFPGHVAAIMETPTVSLFGATYPQMSKPLSSSCSVNYTAGTSKTIARTQTSTLQPEERNGCLKPCHLIECSQYHKCIDNIQPYRVVKEAIRVAPECFAEYKKPIISAYCSDTTPFANWLPEVLIKSYLNFCKEFVIVGDPKEFKELKKKFGKKLKILKKDSMEKCTGDYIWKVEVDEIVPKWKIKTIFELLKNRPDATSLCVPIITFDGGMKTIDPNDPPIKEVLLKKKDVVKRVNKESDKKYLPQKLIYKYNKLTHTPNSTNIEEYIEELRRIANSDTEPCIYKYEKVDYDVAVRNRAPQDVEEMVIYQNIVRLHNRILFGIQIDRHPEEFLNLAMQRDWNQNRLYTEGALL